MREQKDIVNINDPSIELAKEISPYHKCIMIENNFNKLYIADESFTRSETKLCFGI